MTLPDDFKQCVDFHGHVCPGLVLGYQATRFGLEWLREHRAEDEEIVAIVENDACFVDAVQVLSGCTFGKGNFIFRDYGKIAVTFLSRNSNRGVRISLKPDKTPSDPKHRELFQKIQRGDATEEERKEFYKLHEKRSTELLQKKPEELFNIKEVEMILPPKARIEPSVICDECHEPTMKSKTLEHHGRILCKECAQAISGRGE